VPMKSRQSYDALLASTTGLSFLSKDAFTFF
jgi:hypothetical protein